jgi:hypothetical protein
MNVVIILVKQSATLFLSLLCISEGHQNDILNVQKNPSSGEMPNLHKSKMAANIRTSFRNLVIILVKQTAT